MYNSTRDYGRKGSVVSGISAVDIALWDIAGKYYDQPVYQLLGGAFRTKIKPYATGFYRIKGKGEASEYLKFPVVSGNVSFYNQTKDEGIKPTPAIGGVGLIKDYNKMITMDFKEIDNVVLVIGKTEGHLDQTLFARNILDEKNGPPPEINLFNEKNNGETLLKLIDNNLIKSAHDVSLGGIITAVAKMCIKGKKGINIKKPKYLINEIEYFFAEDQGRYIIEINKKDFKKVADILHKNAVHFDELGTINENELYINDKTKVTIDELSTSNKSWLTNYMSK